MNANALLSGVRAGAPSPRTLRRVAMSVATMVLAALSIYFHARTSAQHASVRSATERSALNVAAPGASASSMESFVATWAAQRATTAEQTTLNWAVRDARDLRASLLALDATSANVQRVSVAKRDSGYTISVEALP